MPRPIPRRLPLLAALAWIITALPAQAQGLAENLTRLTFLHVNDVYEHAPREGHGGLAELGTLLARERAAAPGPVFTTFGGDLISPSLASSITQGRHMIEIFNALGTDIAVLGNHEFDLGRAVAAARIADSRFPWLAANVTEPDGSRFATTVPSVIREVAGLKIGFIGVITRATADLAPQLGLRFANELATLREGAAALRRQGADLVIALTHLDLPEDREASQIPGIDLVLGGHDHEPAALLSNGVLAFKAGSDARWLGVVELTVERTPRGVQVRSVGWRMVPNYRTPPAAAIAPLVAAVEAQMDQALGQPLARLTAPLDSRVTTMRTGEAAIGNLVADALRAHLRADVALINGGGLRGNREYPAGHTLTRRDLLAEMPFGNAVVALELTGAQLQAVLEHSVSEVEAAAGRFPQLSGLTLSYAPTAAVGRRVRVVQVAGKPLDRNRRYRLATTDYLQRGGDGFDLLKTARVLVDASGGPLLVNVTAEAIVAAGSVTATTEGRIRTQPR